MKLIIADAGDVAKRWMNQYRNSCDGRWTRTAYGDSEKAPYVSKSSAVFAVSYRRVITSFTTKSLSQSEQQKVCRSSPQ